MKQSRLIRRNSDVFKALYKIYSKFIHTLKDMLEKISLSTNQKIADSAYELHFVPVTHYYN